ncbi:interleukin-1 receptor-like 2 [Octodon degus]|uniref:Interleukin-1 receptor-like 2 n=1 Tax=Octodon degus TaxID=10160 RepID=A0A6P3F707_OCTDE|nr:interleukin-1 receptor-like 2 [Octodon degus]
MRTPAPLLCALSLALRATVTATAGACKDLISQNKIVRVGQPFAWNCTYFPLTYGDVHVTWYRASSGTPLPRNISKRIHQEHTWMLILPLTDRDSGMYQCVITHSRSCHIIHVNLTVKKIYPCVGSRNRSLNFLYDYDQILHLGNSESLNCHMHFPDSCRVQSIRWYKDCEEIPSEQQKFIPWETKLFVHNVSAEDGGKYTCTARLVHPGNPGKRYVLVQSIRVDILESGRPGGKIPKIIYPRNNSIEVRPGSTLIVDCNITDTKENTNLRCWTVNNTMVDNYYSDSKRVQEGIETNISFQDHIFYTVNITFREVKMEDYGLPFICHAGVSAAYIMLRLPAPDVQAYLIGVFVALTVVVTLVLVIYSSFKVDIVLWYRSAFHSKETKEDGKLYDAYVLYPRPEEGSPCHRMDRLVLKLLPEVLERQCGYKLFILGRDGFPGQAVASVIDENVRLCRRLIFVLDPEPGSSSAALLQSLSEEQIAVYSALIRDGMEVILIELETVADYGALPQSIQYIRQKHGAVRWREDAMAQSPSAKTRFWKEVRYRMPPRRYPPASQSQSQRYTPSTCAAGKWQPTAGSLTH